MAALQVGSTVDITFALGNGQNSYDAGTVITMNSNYVEITNQYNQDIAYPWYNIVKVFVVQ
jgi:hypothetical protein